MAERTGGEFHIFTGNNQLPDPENYLNFLRNTYLLEYQSKVRESGEHKFYAEIKTPFGTLTTPPQKFEISIQKPDPAFILPPLEIIRRPPSEDKTLPTSDISVRDYTPSSYDIHILVSFPDERIRPIKRTSLYVNDKIVDENTEPPFEQFTWDLSKYSSNASYRLRVEAEDSLGLVGSSIETMVQVSIEHPKASPWAWVYDNVPVLSVLTILIAGAVLFLVLVLGGRIKPRSIGIRLKRSRRETDPVTQAVQVTEEPTHRFPKWVNRFHWPQRQAKGKTPAFLSRISESDLSELATPIPITEKITTIGNDPDRATLVINDPSVEPLHARLILQSDGSYFIFDEDTIAGTWINYTPVSKEGTTIEHGDLLHIGQISFRFTIHNPTRVRKPVVIPIDSEEDA